MLASNGFSALTTLVYAAQRCGPRDNSCRKSFLLLLAAPLLAILAACSTGGNDDDDPVIQQVQAPFPFKSLEVTPLADTAAVGTTVQFSATGIKEDDSTETLTTRVRWGSDSETVAQIDATGVATGIAPGTAIITAEYTSDGRTLERSAGITVTSQGLVSINVVAADTGIAAGTSTALTATGNFSDGSTQDISGSVTWQSSDDGIVSVDASNADAVRANGLVTGSADITAILNGESDTVTITVTDAVLESIAVTPPTATVVAGTEQQFTATGSYSDGSTQPLTGIASWESSNTGVATVGDDAGNGGLATAAEAGETTISATLDGIIGEASLTVTEVELVSIAVTPSAPSIAAGTEQQFTAVGTFSDDSTQDITTSAVWSSSDEDVASIANADGQRGLATSSQQGTTTISATMNGISGSTELTVGEQSLLSIDVTPTNPSIAAGTTQQFTATGNYSDNSTQDLTASVSWQSSNTAVAAIDAAGLATADAAGSSEISASLNGISGDTTLTVTVAELRSLQITPDAPTVTLGDTRQLTATGTFSDGNTQDLTTSVTWGPTNSEIATVSNADDSNGLATARGLGTVTVTATSGDISDETELTVVDRVLVSLVVTPADSTLTIGGEQQFTATGTYEDGGTAVLTDTVNWISSNTQFATIDNAAERKGLAVAVAEGTTTIEASLGDVSGSTELSVSPATLEAIQIEPGEATVADGETQQFSAIGSFSDGETRNITAEVSWASGNTEVASISNADGSKGLATATAEGESTITATSDDVQGSARLVVGEPRLTSIAVSAPNDFIEVGGEQQYTATGSYTDNSTVDLTDQVAWSSSNENIASVITGGLVVGNSVGNVTISATLDDITGEAALEVREPDVEEPTLLRIEIAPLDASIDIADTLQYNATAFYSDETEVDRTDEASWSSSNENIASFSDDPAETGLARGNSEGTVTVTATFEGEAAETSLEVRPEVVTLTAIEIRPQNASVERDGEPLQFTVTAFYSDDTNADRTNEASWSSSNENVALISDDPAASRGLAQGNGVGNATITAAFEGLSVETNLEVVEPARTLTGITIAPLNASIETQQSQQFTATANYSNDTSESIANDAVSWSSSEPNVADFEVQNGEAFGFSEGTTTITGEYEGFSAEATLQVIQPERLLERLEIAPLDTSIAAGRSLPYTATGFYSNSTSEDLTRTVSWSSSNTEVASISNGTLAPAGIAQGISEGRTTITATARTADGSPITEETILRVTAPELESISIQLDGEDVEAFGMTERDTENFSAIGRFSDGSSRDITGDVEWRSSETGVATVNQDGVVEAVRAGEAVIRATYRPNEDNRSDSVTISVESLLI